VERVRGVSPPPKALKWALKAFMEEAMGEIMALHTNN